MARQRIGKRRDAAQAAPNGGAVVGHEVELWAMADALRGSMDAAEYKHVVLGLIRERRGQEGRRVLHPALRRQGARQDDRAVPPPSLPPLLRLVGMFVQSIWFVRAHASGNWNGGKAKADISIYGQEPNHTSWRLAS